MCNGSFLAFCGGYPESNEIWAKWTFQAIEKTNLHDKYIKWCISKYEKYIAYIKIQLWYCWKTLIDNQPINGLPYLIQNNNKFIQLDYFVRITVSGTISNCKFMWYNLSHIIQMWNLRVKVAELARECRQSGSQARAVVIPPRYWEAERLQIPRLHQQA